MVRSIVNDRGDIDIDFADRTEALRTLSHIPASMIRDGKIVKHNTGVYFHAVPMDPLTGLCSFDYDTAETNGMFKIDMLNVSVYNMVRDESHLIDMMERPLDWTVFENQEFVSHLFHLGNYGDLCRRLKPKSINHLAMLLALVRPGKRHLISTCERRGFDSISDEIWEKSDEDGYSFKHAHAVSYAMLVYVHANLLLEQAAKDAKVNQR